MTTAASSKATTKAKEKTEAGATAPASTPPAPMAEPKPREEMNLQEKFVELRKSVPKITKEKHSDGVDYKFAKIDDVWGAITPTMNDYGVNFDVINEQNAKLSTMTAKTKYGERLMFLYEADLTIEWTNADNPDDVITVYTHAVAWNDDPAKAKGSAWTYALKYYLFEKFSVDMGDTDPDMQGLSPEPIKSPQNSQNQSNGPTGHQHQSGASGGYQSSTKRLSENQLNRMYLKAEDAGMNKEQTDARIVEKYNKTDPAALTRQEYDEICAALDKAKLPGGMQR